MNPIILVLFYEGGYFEGEKNGKKKNIIKKKFYMK